MFIFWVIIVLGLIIRIILLISTAVGDSFIETKKEFIKVFFIPFYWWYLLFQSAIENLD